MNWREQRQELRLLKQGITDDPYDWKHHKDRGTSIERRTAFKELYGTLERRTQELARYERVTAVVDPVFDEHRNDQLFPVLRTDRFDGVYSILFLFDPRPEGGLVSIQKHDNEKYGATYTVTQFGPTLNADGSRDSMAFTIGRDNWDAASPWVDVNHALRKNDRLDEALLSGSLLRDNHPLMTAGATEQISGSMLTATEATALSELVPQWIPVTRAQDAW